MPEQEDTGCEKSQKRKRRPASAAKQLTVLKKKKETAEFGDFQTPPELARQACRAASLENCAPASIVEPTCGTGGFLTAALDRFKNIKKAVGVEINPAYVKTAASALRRRLGTDKVQVISGDFFKTDWADLFQSLSKPILVVGNPPWVTNSELGSLGSSNLPKKDNFRKYRGLDAMTGKSNFDISEWMLIRLLETLNGKPATLATLCKTSVARKVLAHAWKNEIGLDSSHIYPIDASEHFGASVNACFLVCHLSPSGCNRDGSLYENISKREALHTIGFREGALVADIGLYDRWKHLQGKAIYKWRSGIKHDCSRVMELRKEGRYYRNGFGKTVELEERCLFPALKSSDLAHRSQEPPRRWMMVTQTAVGDETQTLKRLAPKTWDYLQENAPYLDRRASSIYNKRPRFSVFGVGPYTFAPWKVAISGFSSLMTAILCSG
ncbi:MAG: N-6 DNA methylase, partial [Nitrospinales bacterium]